MAFLAGTVTCAGTTALADLQRVRIADNAESQNAPKATAAPADNSAKNRVDELIERAGQHHNNSEWKAAVADATEALKIAPNSASAHNIRGDALAQLRQFDRAIADLSDAIRLDPRMRAAYVNRAAAYEASGHDDLALADLATVTGLYPDWEVGHRVRYEILLKHGRYAEAIPSMTKRSELLPAHVYILTERAEAYHAIGDFEHAFADYDEAIRRSPKDGRFWEGRAMLHHARGDEKNALADLTSAIEVAPNAKDLYINRARVYRALGDTAAAEADEARARNVPKNWPDANEFMLFLVLGFLVSWPKIILGTAAGIFIRHRIASPAIAFAICAAEAVSPAPDIVFMVLSGVGGIFWWSIGRLIRRVAWPRREQIKA